jgi:hypothetical protein
MKFLNSTWLKVPGTVQTSSRFRKWWLVSVRGYHIEREMDLPKKLSGGAMVYKKTWALRPKD